MIFRRSNLPRLNSGKQILTKIIATAATRWHILKLKCTKFDFGWGSVPVPGEGAYMQRFPRLPSKLKKNATQRNVSRKKSSQSNFMTRSTSKTCCWSCNMQKSLLRRHWIGQNSTTTLSLLFVERRRPAFTIMSRLLWHGEDPAPCKSHTHWLKLINLQLIACLRERKCTRKRFTGELFHTWNTCESITSRKIDRFLFFRP